MLKPWARSLAWRYLMFWAWAAFLLAGFTIDELVTSHMHNEWVHWLTDVATLSLSLLAGRRTQAWLLAKIDPDGARRRDIQQARTGSLKG